MLLVKGQKVDVIVMDSAHGHSSKCSSYCSYGEGKNSPDLQVIAGNVRQEKLRKH